MLCSIVTFQFLKSDSFLLNAQELQSSSAIEAQSSQVSSESKASSESKSSESTKESSKSEESSSSTPASESSSSSSSTSQSSSSSSSSSTTPPTSSSSSSTGQSSTGSSSSQTQTPSESSSSSEAPAGAATPEEVETNYNYSVTKNSTTQEFIDSIKKDAQEVAWDSDLYASVMMAQAILETGSGNSKLSSAPNYNLFGIKGSYDGESVSFPTQEDDGSGNLYTINAAFRKYPSVKESLEDYAKLLKTNFYKGTWKSNTDSYEDATKFLTGKYATDTSYNKKLNALIETYKLTDYDVEPGTDRSICGHIKWLI